MDETDLVIRITKLLMKAKSEPSNKKEVAEQYAENRQLLREEYPILAQNIENFLRIDYNQSVESLGIPKKILNLLEQAEDIFTVRDLADYDAKGLVRSVRGLREDHITEIRDRLKLHGLKLGTPYASMTN